MCQLNFNSKPDTASRVKAAVIFKPTDSIFMTYPPPTVALAMMQQPTIQNVRIRSTRDAHQIFLGVARNVLPLITRRLDSEERRAIIPGNVYVWEERGSNNNSGDTTSLGMERW